MQAGAVRHRDGFAVRCGLWLVFYTEGSLDSIKNFAVTHCALIFKIINYVETSQMCLRPQSAQGERESARSEAQPFLWKGLDEGRLAGATERLFERPARAGYSNMRNLTIQIIHL